MGSISELDIAKIFAKYDEERDKRLRPDGLAQYADVAKSDGLKHFAKDPWRTSENPYLNKPRPLANGDHSKVLIVGTGFGALLFAVRFLEVGFKAEDLVFVDSAWGFGGTWYWNRYPGLMCDVESSCYLPLLEETGYIPKHRYSYGPELRAYSELVASKWKLFDRAMFGCTIQKTEWNEESAEWVTTIRMETADNHAPQTIDLRSDYFILSSGILNRPKVSRLPGLAEFKGHMFHTSRWDYDYTGGTPEQPDMNKLRGKRVAFLGTGATGIQVVPELAKWAEHLTVLQRTPSAVDVRGQRPIDAERWEKDIQVKEGWQRARRENMAAFLSNGPELPTSDLVNDGWTSFPSFSALVGSPRANGVNHANVAEYVETLHMLDLPRQQGVRERVTQTVKDADTAAKLQPWFPGWCKRPCFHDEYLDTFNRTNVTLADTDGKGIGGFTANGVLCNGQEIPADVVILGTGFEPFSAGSPAFRAGMTITGRDGFSMDDKWERGPGTLHGVLTRGFPNLILAGLTEAGSAVNIVHAVDVLATHTAHIIQMARESSQAGSRKILIEPTESAEETWSMRVAEGAYGYGGLAGCTPSYTTREGERMKESTPEAQLKMARGLAWSKGILDFTKVIEDWEKEGDLSEVEIQVL